MRLLRLAAPLLGALLVSAGSLSAQRPAPKAPSKSAPPKAAAPKPSAPPAAPTTGTAQGVAIDSVHGEPLVSAMISVDGSSRVGITDSLGRFLIDSVPPGEHRLLVQHPLLDTLGISLVTMPLQFAIGTVTRTVVAVPMGETLAKLFCPAARRALGPSALVGRVREPDTDSAAVGARVSFVWYDPDPPGLPSNLRIKKQPRVREATVGADGTYRLCGLPEKYEGKLQAQRKDGGATAEVALSQDDGVLTLRSMSVAALPRVANGDTSAATRAAVKGSARVVGKVLNANGAPVANARIGLMGVSAATLTRANGEFMLDSLPSGTQALVVRQIGYRPTEVPVELSARSAARVTVKLGLFVPELTPVEVVSRRDQGLQKVGFLDRKRTGAGGYFLDGDQIEKRNAQQFTDFMRTVPGIRVAQSSNGQATLQPTRSASGNGCVTVWVDGAMWQSLEPGDLDSFVRPNEVSAIEVYNGVNMPSQFQTPGNNCSAVVVWTKTRVLSRGK